MNDVGKHIRALRKEKNLSQETLADSLHVTRQAVSQWENGRTQPDLDTLKSIAEFFDVDLLAVIYGKKQRTQSDERLKKQHIRGLIIFGLLAIAFAIFYIYFKPYLKRIGESNFDMLTYFLFSMYFPPIIYLFSTVASLHGASLLWRLDIHSAIVKRTLLIASITVLAFYYIVVLLWFFNAVNFFLFNVTSAMARIPVLFLLPGIGLFLGTQKHRPHHDNTFKASL